MLTGRSTRTSAYQYKSGRGSTNAHSVRAVCGRVASGSAMRRSAFARRWRCVVLRDPGLRDSFSATHGGGALKQRHVLHHNRAVDGQIQAFTRGQKPSISCDTGAAEGLRQIREPSNGRAILHCSFFAPPADYELQCSCCFFFSLRSGHSTGTFRIWLHSASFCNSDRRAACSCSVRQWKSVRRSRPRIAASRGRMRRPCAVTDSNCARSSWVDVWRLIQLRWLHFGLLINLP